MHQFIQQTLTSRQREVADRRYMIWCTINLRPLTLIQDAGYKMHVGYLFTNCMTAPPCW